MPPHPNEKIDIPRLIDEGIVYGVLNERLPFDTFPFSDCFDDIGTIGTTHPRVYTSVRGNLKLTLGRKSYINSCHIFGSGLIQIGNFCPISFNEHMILVI